MFNGIYRDRKVLITGNTGFKGSWLTIWLLGLGAKVYGISKGIPTIPSIFEKLKLRDKIIYFREDVRNLDRIVKIIRDVKPDFVFHLAAQPIVSLSYDDPVETISSNVSGTANILEGLRIYNRRCVAVIITSDKCYDNVEWLWGYRETDKLGGKDIYSGSKGAAELIFKSYFHSFLRDSEVRIASARAGNVIGGGDWAPDRIVPDCMRAWSANKTVDIRRPHATRPWQHVLEPLSGYLTLAMVLTENKLTSGENYNFGPNTEQDYTVSRLIESMSRFWKFNKNVRPYRVVKNRNFSEAGLLKLNCDKANLQLNWLPTLEYGQMVEFTSRWYYEFYKKNRNIYGFTADQISQYEQLAVKKGIEWTR